MKVTVKLFGVFRGYFPPGAGPPSFQVELKEGSGVEAVFARLGIPDGEPREIIRNHRLAASGEVLHDGDIIAIFPPLAGGG